MGSSATRFAPVPGDVLDGRFRLSERLGHGGFGDVWRAEELLPDGTPFREVALKLLIAGGSDAFDWAEEAKLLASFRHPSLVTIYAAGILATTPPQRFVAMELLEGENLAELLRARRRVAWRRVLAWATSAAAALDLIHAAGVVHLDLKPANLFLASDGALKVLDFGIARRAGMPAVIPRRGERLAPTMTAREAEAATGLFIAGADITQEDEAFAATRPVSASGSPRVVIGTPGFMAPEVLDQGEPTAAADAYALAVCVVQLVTGHLPLEAPDEPTSWDDPTAVSQWLDAIRTATLRGALRPIDASAMGFPRGVAALVKRLLAVDPAQRGVVPGGLGALFQEVWERPHGVPDPPYFGLAAYPSESEGLLFGRDDDTARLGRELEFEPALVLQGPAFAGKSSLIMAGLVPHLARRGADGKDDWIAVTITPRAALEEGSIDAALSSALARVSPELADADVDAIAGHCDRSHVGLVIVVDPLDAPADAPASSRTRIDALIAALSTGGTRPGLRLLGAIREESAPALLATPLGAGLRAALRFVSTPATAAVKDIVAAPAHFAGVPVFGADAIAADVQRELRGGSARLPYVALSLAEFWATRSREPLSRAPGRSSAPASGLSSDRWKAAGGVRGAVVRHAERVLRGFEGEDHAVAEEILLRLSTTDGRPVSWDVAELVDTVSPEHGRRVLDRLTHEHVLHMSRDTVEIGHPALLTDWQVLASARLSQMDRLAFLERLREARVAWERADGHRDFLLHGELLDEVRVREAWIRRGLTPTDRAFLAASKRRARVVKAVRWAIGAFVVLVLAGGAWAQRLLERAQEAEARAKAAAIELEQLAELAARARRTDDPYQRVAFAAAAMERGSPDGLLPLEIAGAASNAARGIFLTLEHFDGPSFPWDDRFLLGLASSQTLAIVDFRPPEPDVIEDVDLDFDPEQAEALHFKMPVIRRFRPHEAPIVERVAFAFDTAFATRAADGEVKVFRLREDGVPALAAIAPVRCAGAMHAAALSPVLACATERGVARWDLRRTRAGAEDVVVHAFQGNVGDISADGERVAAFGGKEVLLWTPAEGAAVVYTAPRPVTLVRLSPRDRVAALLEGKVVEIVDERRPGAPIFTVTARDKAPEQLRWDDGGLDLALCNPSGGRWHHLKRGARAKDDAPPRGEPCVAPRPKNQPEPIRGTDDYRELGEREVGPHLLAGGFRLRRRRFLSHDLVLFDGASPRVNDAALGKPDAVATIPPAAARLLRFEAKDEIGGDEPRADKDSIVAVERDDAAVVFQIGDELRFHAIVDGSRLFARKGNFLRRCSNGRFLAWIAAGDRWELFDAWTGGKVADVPREPGLIVGADASCTNLYAQRLDGTLTVRPLAGGPSRDLVVADGYVYLARPSPARGNTAAGLLLALGSGAIARIDETSSTVQVLAYATPRATTLADGPQPGEVVFADATGVVLVRPGAAPVWLRDGSGGVEWEDISAAPDGASILLAADDRLAVLDVARRELLGSIPMEGRGRLARWDDEGSVLAWSFARTGGAEGAIIPRGVTLAHAVSSAISNLTVEKGRIAIHR
ncbi:Serine/threonine kinase [Minicystis rosea]|nr:Serine/threonine kinase [Minicystis rosea]